MRVPGTRESFARRASKNRSGDPFYGSAVWRRLRLAKLSASPLCEDCLLLGRTSAGEVVDHVLDRVDRPDLQLEYDNLRTLCVRCHNAKTAKTMARRRAKAAGAGRSQV